MNKHFVEMRGEKLRVFEDREHEKPLSKWMSLGEFEKFYGFEGIDFRSVEVEDESLK